MSRLVVVATHPVQYQAPLFRALANSPRLDLRVLYAYLPTPEEQGVGFGEEFTWDVPVLEGYSWATIDRLERHGESPHGFKALSAPGIREQLAAEQPEAVLVTGWHSRLLVQAARAAKRLRVPVLVRGESNDLRARPVWKRLGHRWLFRHYTAFLAIGRANRRFFERSGVDEKRIFDVPYGVENGRFAAAAAELRPRRAELRERWQVPAGGFCVLFVGKFQDKKRPLDLLNALHRARAGRPGLRLLMVGSGALDGELRAKVRDLRLPVTFAGFLNQTEVPRAYAAADALVLPSDAGETWGLVVNEAMASGLPAVVSDHVGCHEDLIQDGITGFSYPLGDIPALASCLTTLAEDPIRAASMGEAARDLVTERYSIHRAVEGVVQALAEVAAGAGSGG